VEACEKGTVDDVLNVIESKLLCPELFWMSFWGRVRKLREVANRRENRFYPWRQSDINSGILERSHM